jgi:hypothetical protein
LLIKRIIQRANELLKFIQLFLTNKSLIRSLKMILGFIPKI